MIPSGFAQITFIFGGPGMPNGAACTLGVDVDGPDLPALIADEVYTQMLAADIMEHTSGDVSNTLIHVKCGPDDIGPSAAVSGVGPGGDVDAQASPNTAYLIRKQTGLGGHANRGRMFWPGVPQAKINQDGTILAGTRENQTLRFSDFFDKLTANSLTPVLLHGSATTPTPLTGLVCDPTAATQRRRLRR